MLRLETQTHALNHTHQKSEGRGEPDTDVHEVTQLMQSPKVKAVASDTDNSLHLLSTSCVLHFVLSTLYEQSHFIPAATFWEGILTPLDRSRSRASGGDM